MANKEYNPNGVGVNSGSYFGSPFSTDQAALVLISAPWDVTVSYGAGAVNAPDAIIEASVQLDLYDPMAHDQWRRGIATADIDCELEELSKRLRGDAERVIAHLEEGGEVTDDVVVRKLKRVNAGCRAMCNNIYAQTKAWLDAGKIVGLVGGDHSTPYGAISAVAERYASIGVLHIDAHCDLRDSYEGFEFSHASIMFNILRDVSNVEKIVEVGVRDYCDDEAKIAAESSRVEMFNDYMLSCAAFEGVTWQEQCRRIVATLPQNVYVSFDIDGLSMDNCPHTGTPVVGGLSFNQAAYLIDAVVCSGRRIVGFDLVEVVPDATERVDAIVGARVLYKLCGLTLKSNN